MKPYCLIIIVFTAIAGVCHADAPTPFLKPGSWYIVTAPAGTSLCPGITVDVNNYFEVSFKILEIGANQWCRVRYSYLPMAQVVGQPMIIKEGQEWLNFAHVVFAKPEPEPNYKTLFPGGFKIVDENGK